MNDSSSPQQSPPPSVLTDDYSLGLVFHNRLIELGQWHGNVSKAKMLTLGSVGGFIVGVGVFTLLTFALNNIEGFVFQPSLALLLLWTIVFMGSGTAIMNKQYLKTVANRRDMAYENLKEQHPNEYSAYLRNSHSNHT